MNLEIPSKESPPLDDLTDKINKFRDVKTNQDNTYVIDEINKFSKIMKEKYSSADLKRVANWHSLIGSSRESEE